MDANQWLTLSRLVAYVVLVPALSAIAIDVYNAGFVRRAGLYGLSAVYYAIALIAVSVEFFDPAMSRSVRSMFTPVLIMQTALAVWVWLRPTSRSK